MAHRGNDIWVYRLERCQGNIWLYLLPRGCIWKTYNVYYIYVVHVMRRFYSLVSMMIANESIPVRFRVNSMNTVLHTQKANVVSDNDRWENGRNTILQHVRCDSQTKVAALCIRYPYPLFSFVPFRYSPLSFRSAVCALICVPDFREKWHDIEWNMSNQW